MFNFFSSKTKPVDSTPKQVVGSTSTVSKDDDDEDDENKDKNEDEDEEKTTDDDEDNTPNDDEDNTPNDDEDNTPNDDDPKDKTLRILFVTHQNRIRLSVIMPLLKLMGLTNFPTKNKFSNCSILKLTIITKINDDTCNVKLDLIYSGDSTKNKAGKVYWVVKNTDNTDNTDNQYKQPFTTLQITQKINVNLNKLNQFFDIDDDIFNKYPIVECYFLRHGKSQHNPSKTKAFFSNFSYSTDKQITIFQENTELLQDGITQAQDAGRFLGNYLSKKKIDALGVSDLYRTQQTASVCLTEYFNEKYRVSKTGLYSSNLIDDELDSLVKKLYVIPCSHELDENAQDDSGPNNNKVMNRENNTTCLDANDYNPYTSKTKQCGYIYINNGKYKLNWTLYKKFYNNQYRNTSSNNCQNTNFIGYFLNNNYDNSVGSRSSYNSPFGGKSRKRKTTKRKTTKRKSRKRKTTTKRRRKSRKHYN